MGNRLCGHVSLITGGGSGLGLALVQRFIEEGAVGVGVLEKSKEKAALLTEKFGPAVCVTVGDAGAMQDNAKAVERTMAKFGHLDSFVGNAGIWDHGVAMLELPLDRIEMAFDELFAVNARGYLLGARAAAKALIKTCGSMIFTLSNGSFLPGGGGPLYTMSKHAGVGLVRQLAYELAPKVRVNGVAPSGMATDLRGLDTLAMADRSVNQVREPAEVASIMPLQLYPKTNQYTGAYVWLASKDDSVTVTGDVIRADCGLGIRGIRHVAGGLEL